VTDDELRAALQRSHADDAPPRFVVPHRSPRAWAWAWALAGAAAAAIAILLVVTRHHDAPVHTDLGMAVTSLQTPLDSLLTIPDTELLSTTPHFAEGALP
jgi:hypothetical protein